MPRASLEEYACADENRGMLTWCEIMMHSEQLRVGSWTLSVSEVLSSSVMLFREKEQIVDSQR